MRRIAVAVCLTLALASPAFAERVIVKCKDTCDPVAVAVTQDGGRVVQRFKYVTALVAEVSDLAMPHTRALLDSGAIRKDQIITAIPDTRDPRGSTSFIGDEALGAAALDATALASAEVGPAAYAVTNVMSNVQPLHAAGFTGRGMKVAVIDTGMRPGYPHLSLDNSVIGGEDFVGDGRGYNNPENNGHGTFTAGLISANVAFPFAPNSLFLAVIRAECPACIVGSNIVPMVGSAPEASIYALRVLGINGSGRQSDVIRAMERVIELRRGYDAGHPETPKADGSFDALNIRVANMSLGGPTLFPGHDIQDELTKAFLDSDIVLVVAAGNNGPSGATIASPATGIGSLTVGAASTKIHERILRDLQFGIGIGPLYRPFDGTQTATFSSRGPNADGRSDPDIVANGFASFGQGFGNVNQISLASGTSAAAPTVAGIAALLRQAVPTATARQVRNALILTANPDIISDGSGPNDRGAGFVNAAAARELLTSTSTPVPDVVEAAADTNKNVVVNLQNIAGIETFTGDVTHSTGPLLPGQRFETFYRVLPDTSAVIVTLSDVTSGTDQNKLFGDDVILTVHSAKMSAVPGVITDPAKPSVLGDYEISEFTTGGRFVINQPELGILRVTVNGDWVNASPISGVIRIQSLFDSTSGQHSEKNKIVDGGEQVVPFVVPFGTKLLSVRASWRADWGSYPANNIDVALKSPDGKLNFDAATLDNPEHADIADPQPGNWSVIILGAGVSSKGGDQYTLTITADGQVIKPKR